MYAHSSQLCKECDLEKSDRLDDWNKRGMLNPSGGLEHPAQGGRLEKHREQAVVRGQCSWWLRGCFRNGRTSAEGIKGEGLSLDSESNTGRMETVRLKCDMTKIIG